MVETLKLSYKISLKKDPFFYAGFFEMYWLSLGCRDDDILKLSDFFYE